MLETRRCRTTLLTDREFELFRALVQERTGIALGPFKRAMLQSRLSPRLSARGLTTFAAYYHCLQREGPAGMEWTHFISAITTNVTEFFREAHHFRFLVDQWLTPLRRRGPQGATRSLRIWSAGCSTGEEPYSIALTLQEALGRAAPAWDLRILASDIDAEAIARAEAGIYLLERSAAIPADLLRRHFLRGTADNAGLICVGDHLQALVTFRRLNLVDKSWPLRSRFDVIFCRNVLIYFDRPTQRQVLQQLLAFLKPGGLLFLGHSEVLHGQLHGIHHLENTIYQKP